MSPRSKDSTAREARRARSSTSLSGIRGRADGGAVTGHSALFNIEPAFELGRLPEGGGYPAGFIEVAARLMGCTDLEQVVHLCAGSVRAARTVDIREGLGATIVADVRWLPFRRDSLRWIMADPPYSREHAEELWRLGKLYPTPAVLMRECAEVLAPGGRLALMHFVVPRLPATLRRVGTYGVTVGCGYRIRALTIAEKVAPAGALELEDRP